MTTDDMKYQAVVLSKYRAEGIIPTLQKIRTETGISITTIATFLHGNSANEPIRKYLKLRFEKNFDPLPEDIQQLFAIWDKDSDQAE